jgi:hypothetical protein
VVFVTYGRESLAIIGHCASVSVRNHDHCSPYNRCKVLMEPVGILRLTAWPAHPSKTYETHKLRSYR